MTRDGGGEGRGVGHEHGLRIHGVAGLILLSPCNTASPIACMCCAVHTKVDMLRWSHTVGLSSNGIPDDVFF